MKGFKGTYNPDVYKKYLASANVVSNQKSGRNQPLILEVKK